MTNKKEIMENTLTTEIMVLREKNAELVAWKKSAQNIFKSLNLQVIGDELNLKLGSDISSQVLPEIKKIKQHNAELVEVLKLSHCIIYGDDGSRGLLDCMDGYYTGVLSEELDFFESKIESLINSNITK